MIDCLKCETVAKGEPHSSRYTKYHLNLYKIRLLKNCDDFVGACLARNSELTRGYYYFFLHYACVATVMT